MPGLTCQEKQTQTTASRIRLQETTAIGVLSNMIINIAASISKREILIIIVQRVSLKK